MKIDNSRGYLGTKPARRPSSPCMLTGTLMTRSFLLHRPDCTNRHREQTGDRSPVTDLVGTWVMSRSILETEWSTPRRVQTRAARGPSVVRWQSSQPSTGERWGSLHLTARGQRSGLLPCRHACVTHDAALATGTPKSLRVPIRYPGYPDAVQVE
jgi:hypothetical protein